MKKVFLFKEQAVKAAKERIYESGGVIGTGRTYKFNAPDCLFDESVHRAGKSMEELMNAKLNIITVTEFWGAQHAFGYIRPEVQTLGGLARLMTDLYIPTGEENELVRQICHDHGWHYLQDVHHHPGDGRYFSRCVVAYDPVNHETLRYHGDLGFIIELGAPEWNKGRETWEPCPAIARTIKKHLRGE